MKFVIKTNEGKDHWWFVLVAGNGEPVATSEMYTRKQSALDTINSIRDAFGADEFAVPVIDQTV